MKMACFLNFVLLLLLQICAACFALVKTNITTDQTALTAFKEHITYDPYNILANWSGTSPVCSWVGVYCDAHQQRVVKLNLSDMGLNGSIPSQMGNLSFLAFLSFRNNSFHGSLPSELTRLTFLDLGFNFFSGVIPSYLGSFTKLESLYLSHNDFTGSVPTQIGNLTMLKKLYLDHNDLTGSIPKSFGNCTVLQEINLSENNLTGEIPAAIGELGRLEILTVHDNALSGKIPRGLFNISTVKSISMFLNQLSGGLPSTMGIFLPNLVDLHLGFNALDGMIPSTISNASQLSFLDLSDNSFTGLIPIALGNLRYLQVLRLANNLLGSELSFLTALTNCKQLRRIMLSGNPLNNTLPVSIGNFSTSLELFWADNCNIQGSIPGEISNLTSLFGLSLWNNKLTGTIQTTIGRLEKLQLLYLQGNKLQGIIVSDICRLKNLAYLFLGGNELVGSIPECLSHLTALRYLNLRSNNLNSTIPQTFWTLKYILNIDLSSNSLSGNIPSSIGNLVSADEIDLSSNQLSGEIPSSIGALSSLTYLSLANNGLQGPIPESIGNARGLEFLDLSRNNLSGGIPKLLEALRFLIYLNVSFNSLEGEIPSGGIFLNVTAVSYIMNKALCGAPRFRVPPCNSGAHQSGCVSLGCAHLLGFLLKLMIPLVVSVLIAFYIFMWSVYRRRNNAEGIMTPSREILELHELPRSQSRRYTYLELEQATDWFSESNLLGNGHFGSVHKGKLKDGRVVAIKVFNAEEPSSLGSFDVECQILRNIKHVNVVKTICINNSVKALVMEYMANGSLDKWLHTHNYHLDIFHRLVIMIETARALKYLHQRCIIHCDLKPSNILLDEDMVAHVSDFSIATFVDPDPKVRQRQSKLLCTVGYVAPEYGFHGIVSKLTDVYSFGIVLMETFTGKKPTHEMFSGEMSLRRWVMESLPCNIETVIDPSLLQRTEENFHARMKFLSSILRLAQVCSADSPNERLPMTEVEQELTRLWNLMCSSNKSLLENDLHERICISLGAGRLR